MARKKRMQKISTKKTEITKMLREKLKVLRAQLSEKTQAFKQQLKNIEATTYAKAIHDITNAIEKKEEAKLKALLTAEAKFEKKYERKHMKTLTKKMPAMAASTEKKSPKTKGITKGRRGRPAKK